MRTKYLTCLLLTSVLTTCSTNVYCIDIQLSSDLSVRAHQLLIYSIIAQSQKHYNHPQYGVGKTTTTIEILMMR